MKNRQRTLHITQLGLLVALELILGFTPLAFIMVPPAAITLLHIPVIIGGILLGPTDGIILGSVMGITSMIKATTGATSPVDIAFSPFLSGNPIASILVALVGRILLGLSAALLYRLFLKTKLSPTWCIALSAVLASIVHTVSVLGLLVLLFPQLGMGLIVVLMTIVSLNGVLEILAAGIISTAVCKPLLKYFNSKSN